MLTKPSLTRKGNSDPAFLSCFSVTWGVGWPSGIGWRDNVRTAVGSSPAPPHSEGGHVTVMLRGVLIGWFDPGWQVFHLEVCISCSSKLPLVKQAAVR